MKLTEVAYDPRRPKGSLEWFLQNFFDQESTSKYETGEGVNYRTKSGFEIWARGQRVTGVETYPNGDWQANVIHAGTSNVQTTYLPLEDWRVHQTKQIWPLSK